jgi:hypothetical protein
MKIVGYCCGCQRTGVVLYELLRDHLRCERCCSKLLSGDLS